ncbi:MarR family winged helix-turn-helix transcriptional regulator [Alkalicoccus daliensis]|uniref:DNA-binding transcriptional regulator, MarR family n=1 Tax=Alkalicoccus daliensis TaxID=745820 RepID=A0A1H0CSR4_9BACI|nr:MarR family transcriptional regulator [Alkalicoccus daliensis]SDN60721.1 DNA-binding transcriptional regulator, MarR family [Alkalicoccus daliensis]
MKKLEYIDQIDQFIIDISLTMSHEFGADVEVDLSSNQQLMIYLIAKKNIVRVKELAFYMNVSASAISQMAGKLEQLDLLERSIDECNRRQTVLRLLPKGENFVKEMEEKRHAIMRKYLSRLPEDELETMRDTFANLSQLILESQKEGEES